MPSRFSVSFFCTCLFVWSEVQIVCIIVWPMPLPYQNFIICCLIIIHHGFIFLLQACPGCPGNEVIQQMFFLHECSGLSGTDFSWARCTFCPQTYSIKSRSVHEVDAGFISCYFASLLLASVLRFVILRKNFTCTRTVYYWLYLL